MFDKLTSKEAMDFIAKIEEPFKSLPHLPKNITEFFVKIAPWLAIIGAVLGLLSAPVLGLFGALGSLLTLSPIYLISTLVLTVVTLITSIMMFMAFKPLQNREMKGWVFSFWAGVLSVVAVVVSLIGNGFGTAIWALFWILVRFYVLFEMKPFYGAAQSAVKKVEDKMA